MGEQKMPSDVKKKIDNVQAQIASAQARLARLQVTLKSLRKLSRLQNSCIPLREVARMIGRGGDTVLRLVEAGRLKGRKMHPKGHWFITRRSLEKLAAEVGQGGPTHGTQEPHSTAT
jgi:hypothetical protein